jgi:hypothetical protein
VEAVRSLGKLVQDNAHEDLAIIDGLPEDFKKVYQSKKLATLHHLMKNFTPEWPDQNLVLDIISGFQLTGHQKFSGVFEKEFGAIAMPVDLLRKSSPANNTALFA